MNTLTRLEDFPNDLFLEIFEYLHALDLFTAFVSLNQRISAILFLTQLHVVISKFHSYQQMKFLSSHLADHVDQVISLCLEDELRDYSSVISYFFHQHTYINLQSCQFLSVEKTSNFNHVIEKLQNLTKLVSFRMIQPNNCSFSSVTKDQLTAVILTHTSPALRFIDLSFFHSYPNFVARLTLNSTVTYLHLVFQNSKRNFSIYEFFQILRHYRALRVLRMSLHNTLIDDSYQPQLHTLLDIFRDNLPISNSLRVFDCTIQTPCTFELLDCMLRCVPNLRQLIVTIIYRYSPSPNWRDVFDGQQWEQILSTNTPRLDVFDILLIIDRLSFVPNPYATLNSFDGFSKKYPDWYVAIHRQPCVNHVPNEQICLRGFRRCKAARSRSIGPAHINLNLLLRPFTTVVDAPHHLFYSNIKDIYLHIPAKRSIFESQSTGQLYNNADSLIIDLDASTLTLRQVLLEFFHIRTTANNIDQDERMEKISNLIDLTRIKKLEIQPNNGIPHLRLIQKILLACSRLIHLAISNAFIFSSSLINSPLLLPVFHRLQSIDFRLKFRRNYALKFIERFPSLIHLEFYVDSVEKCRSLLTVFLNSLPKLSHIKLHFLIKSFIVDETDLIEFIFQTRRQAYPYHLHNRNEICMEITDKLFDIYLSGCMICHEILSCNSSSRV